MPDILIQGGDAEAAAKAMRTAVRTPGQTFAMAGLRPEAREILQRLLDGFRKLGRAQEAAQVEEVLRQLG